ncbi:hypothetical protein MTO96_048768 [Rhipicephalus appendiculatus]
MAAVSGIIEKDERERTNSESESQNQHSGSEENGPVSSLLPSQGGSTVAGSGGGLEQQHLQQQFGRRGQRWAWRATVAEPECQVTQGWLACSLHGFPASPSPEGCSDALVVLYSERQKVCEEVPQGCGRVSSHGTWARKMITRIHSFYWP